MRNAKSAHSEFGVGCVRNFIFCTGLRNGNPNAFLSFQIMLRDLNQNEMERGLLPLSVCSNKRLGDELWKKRIKTTAKAVESFIGNIAQEGLVGNFTFNDGK